MSNPPAAPRLQYSAAVSLVDLPGVPEASAGRIAESTPRDVPNATEKLAPPGFQSDGAPRRGARQPTICSKSAGHRHAWYRYPVLR